MPTDVLFGLLAIALVLNGALVAVAVRQLRPAPFVRHPSEARQPYASASAASPARDLTAGGAPTQAVAAPPQAVAAPTERAAPAAPEPDVPAPAAAPARTPGTADAAQRATPARARRTARPRKFTLPPLGEDRDRADRAIDLFLGGGRADTPARPHPRATRAAPAGDRRAARDDRMASVAIVAIAGYRTLAVAEGGVERAAAVAEAVEETLRRTARTDDHVVALGGGRFRILLVGSTESAANAYLDRVRTASGPWLAVAGESLDLIAAAAGAGADGDLSRALRVAERRLDRASAGRDLDVETEH